jgi:hypothetical protein
LDSSSGDELAELVGSQLNTVAFVMDYVEFKFNGPILRALTDPIVDTGTSRHLFPSAGSRDALCELIGSDVRSVVVRPRDRIEVDTDRGAKLIIPLDEESRRGVEAAHFVPAAPDGALLISEMIVW